MSAALASTDCCERETSRMLYVICAFDERLIAHLTRMVQKQHYARPPITEAVLELRFEGALTSRELERVRDRFKVRYSTVEEMQLVEVTLEGTKPTAKVMTDSFKLTERNAVDVLIIKSTGIGTIRLAPYESWEHLRSRAQENW